jgi:hypothetical protein
MARIRSRDPHDRILNIFLALPTDEQASVIRELKAAQLGASAMLASSGRPGDSLRPEHPRRVKVSRGTSDAPQPPATAVP